MLGWDQPAWFSVLFSATFKSTVVLGVAYLTALLLRARSAAARHLVWTAAAAALVAMPALSLFLPAWNVPARGLLLAGDPGLVFRTVSQFNAQPAPFNAPLRTRGPAGSMPDLQGAWQLDWGTSLMLIWAAGMSLAMLQLTAAWIRMTQMRRNAPRSRFQDDAGGSAAALGIRHRVEVLEAGSMPMAFGLLRPAIFLPSAASNWDEERRRMVLLHELAHVKRGDLGTHLIARAALALNWWNPLAWLAWREFLKERERAADDLVLTAGARASEYASHLLEVARSFQSRSATAWAAVAMARPSQLEGRLLAILDPRLRRNTVGAAAPLAVAVAAVALVAPFAALRAQDPAQAAAPEVDATIRAALAQKNHAILERAASVYENLRQYDVAQRLWEQALTIRQDVDGPQSGSYAAALVKLGDLAVKQRRLQEAESYYSKAIALGDRPEIVPALLYLGVSRFRNAAEKLDLLQRIVHIVPDSKEAGRALMWMALIKQTVSGSEAEAEGLFQGAIAALSPQSADAGTAMELYARFLRQQNRPAEAEAMESSAREVRRLSASELHASDPNERLPVISPNAYRIGAGIVSPSLVFKVEPEYTEEAKALHLAGTVLLYVEVGPDGTAHNIQVKRSLGMGLDEKAMEAIAKWRFTPGSKDGAPVTVQAIIEINFRLM